MMKSVNLAACPKVSTMKKRKKNMSKKTKFKPKRVTSKSKTKSMISNKKRGEKKKSTRPKDHKSSKKKLMS